MNIESNNEGWTFDESVGWKLIHDGHNIIFFDYTDMAVSTQTILFVGTKEECEVEIIRLNLIRQSEIKVE
jgi:hypothetical protein